MLNEECIEIVGYEGLYWAHPSGYITNARKVLKTYTINSGYACLKLTKNDQRASFLVHRLIATTFINNPENKPYVNHKNGNKLDCGVENLEWVTNSENILHARCTGLNPYNNPSTGLKLGKASKYFNVGYDKTRNKWYATVRHNKKNLLTKRFNNEIDAAKHVNYVIDFYQLDRPKNTF